MKTKKSPEQLRERFNEDVERFSNLETAQQSIMDAPYMLRLLAKSAITLTHPINHILDVGCGAGNNALMLLTLANSQNIAVDLLDIAPNMLARAKERVRAQTSAPIATLEGDIRLVDLPRDHYDVITAAAVLHHLRGEEEWREVFTKLLNALRPGGTFWVSDLVLETAPSLSGLSRQTYSDYLERTGGASYRDEILSSIDACDTPRPLLWQLRLLEEVGFTQIEILHKHACFAAYGARKPQR